MPARKKRARFAAMNLDQIVAGLVLAAVAAVWIGLLMGPARRQQWRGRLGQGWRALRLQRRARREAVDVIERARRRPPAATREGNVIRPRHFQGRRDDDRTLH